MAEERQLRVSRDVDGSEPADGLRDVGLTARDFVDRERLEAESFVSEVAREFLVRLRRAARPNPMP